MTEPTHVVDATGLNCPLPILRAKKMLADMNAGEVVRVMATDSGSVMDFAAFAKQTGHELLESCEENDTFIFLLKKSGEAA